MYITNKICQTGACTLELGMRRFRRHLQRVAQRLGLPLAALAALALLSLGVHAALDWHHHGSVGAGFFHLHVHFGAHHHHHGPADHGGEHRHGEPVEGNAPDVPGSDPPTDRDADGVLILAAGIAPAPAPPAADRPAVAAALRRPAVDHRSTTARLSREPWSPRAPPV
jgi:hypothetical protein